MCVHEFKLFERMKVVFPPGTIWLIVCIADLAEISSTTKLHQIKKAVPFQTRKKYFIFMTTIIILFL
jgi:hypothetical protein